MNKSFIYLKIPHALQNRHRGPVAKALALKSDGRGSNLTTVKSLVSFFFFFSLFIYTFVLTSLGLGRVHFTEYRYYLPFSNNKLLYQILWPTWDRTIIAICRQIICFRRLRTRRIAPSKLLSFSLPCPLPRSHAAVLGILPIRLWKQTVYIKQRWTLLESQANILSNDAYIQAAIWVVLLIESQISLVWNTCINDPSIYHPSTE